MPASKQASKRSSSALPLNAHQATRVGFFFSEVPGSSLTVIGARRGAAETRVGAAPTVLWPASPPFPRTNTASQVAHLLAGVLLGDVQAADALARLEDGGIGLGGGSPEVKGGRSTVIRKLGDLQGAGVLDLDCAAHLCGSYRRGTRRAGQRRRWYVASRAAAACRYTTPPHPRTPCSTVDSLAVAPTKAALSGQAAQAAGGRRSSGNAGAAGGERAAPL